MPSPPPAWCRRRRPPFANAPEDRAADLKNSSRRKGGGGRAAMATIQPRRLPHHHHHHSHHNHRKDNCHDHLQTKSSRHSHGHDGKTLIECEDMACHDTSLPCSASHQPNPTRRISDMQTDGRTDEATRMPDISRAQFLLLPTSSRITSS